MNRTARAIAALAGLAALAACSGDDGKQQAAGDSAPASTAAQAPSFFASEIAPTLQGACATCHLTGQEAGGMSLVPAKAIANLVNVPASEAPALMRVVPGDPDGSYLIMKLEGTHAAHGGTGARMPFGGAPLPPDVIAKFRTWIKEGAKP